MRQAFRLLTSRALASARPWARMGAMPRRSWSLILMGQSARSLTAWGIIIRITENSAAQRRSRGWRGQQVGSHWTWQLGSRTAWAGGRSEEHRAIALHLLHWATWWTEGRCYTLQAAPTEISVFPPMNFSAKEAPTITQASRMVAWELLKTRSDL